MNTLKLLALLTLPFLTGCKDGDRMVVALTGKPTPAQIAAEAEVKPVLFVQEPVVVEPVEVAEVCFPIFRVRTCP